MDRPWYERAFRNRYLDLYAHRNAEEATRAVALLADRTDLRGKRILDVACGAGRHLAALREAGARPAGVDLSPALVRRARAEAPAARADMRRLPVRRGTQDGAVCMFTSFGYFDEPEENRRVLLEVNRVLRPEGWFLLDLLNPERVLAHLEPEGERRVGEATVRERRRYDPARRLLVKEVVWSDPEEGEERWEERLRVFFPDEAEEALAAAGLRALERIGEYDGTPWSPASSRCMLFSRRERSPAEEEGR